MAVDMHGFNLTVDHEAAAPAEFLRKELSKVAAYSALSKEDREAIALAVERISAKSYSAGYNHGRAGQGMTNGRWFKGCWVGSRMTTSG